MPPRRSSVSNSATRADETEVSAAPIKIPTPEGTPEQVHLFEPEDLLAIDAALAAKRALLVRGEPGTGKTQLAAAAALRLDRPLVSVVVDARTQSSDLLWQYDAVARLADAQLQSVLLGRRQLEVDDAKAEDHIRAELKAHLDPLGYVRPGPLWWGINWKDADVQAKRSRTAAPLYSGTCSPSNGVVILIDELDKGEADVPNGLLEALGGLSFSVPGRPEPVAHDPEVPPPLVIVTSNEERDLPDAFVRRCLAISLSLPVDRNELVALLVKRGRAHFKRGDVPEAALTMAAGMLATDRALAIEKGWFPRPGQAEYFDLLRAASEIARRDGKDVVELLEKLARFVLQKKPADRS